jgi:hypothetical protein
MREEIGGGRKEAQAQARRNRLGKGTHAGLDQPSFSFVCRYFRASGGST